MRLMRLPDSALLYLLLTFASNYLFTKIIVRLWDYRLIKADRNSGDVKQSYGNKVDEEIDDNDETDLSLGKKLWNMTKFMLPLSFCVITPCISEEFLIWGITSSSDGDVTDNLASFGLSFLLINLLIHSSIEVKLIRIVLVGDREAHKRMVKFCAAVGAIFMSIVVILCLSPASKWFIRDLHKQSQNVSDMTTSNLLHLMGLPLIEAVASYHEGGLNRMKLSHYTAIARLSDCGMQIASVVVITLTPALHEGIHPTLIPIISLYIGYTCRLAMDIGFWLMLVKSNLPEEQELEKEKRSSSILKAVVFLLPLLAARTVQKSRNVIINLVVSHNLSGTVGTVAAAEAIAVLSIVYPLGRLLHSYLNEIRTVMPVFHNGIRGHHQYSLKVLAIFAAIFTLGTFLMDAVLMGTPYCANFIFHTVLRVSEKLASEALIPMAIFVPICLTVGLRAYCSGILIMNKQTKYLTPSAFIALLGLCLCLGTLQYTRLSGASYGILCYLLTFVIETVCVAVATIVLHLLKKKEKGVKCETAADEKDQNDK